METPPGKVIRSLRQALDMTQAEFGRAAGWSPSTISSWERGSTQPSRIAFKTILAFAEERGVRYQPRDGATTSRPTGELGTGRPVETLPVLRLGSRLPAPTPLVTRDGSREESLGSRRWTDVATHEPEALAASYQARARSLAERTDWQVDARLQVRIGNGTGLGRIGYVAASLAALVIGVGAGVLVRTGLGSHTAPHMEARPALESASAPALQIAEPAPAPPVQVDELALAAVAAPAAAQAPYAAGQASNPVVVEPDPLPPPTMARLESIVALDGTRRASFRVGDRSIALVEGDTIGAHAVGEIANDTVTLTGGKAARKVRLGADAPIE